MPKKEEKVEKVGDNLWKVAKIPPLDENDTWKVGYVKKDEEGKQELIVGVDEVLVHILNKLEKVSGAIVKE